MVQHGIWREYGGQRRTATDSDGQRTQIHPKISADGPSQKIRNGVGVRDGGHVAVFAISERPVSFGAFARLFRDDLGCRNALFLDGSVSSLYAPNLGRSDLGRPLGPLIGAVAR